MSQCGLAHSLDGGYDELAINLLGLELHFLTRLDLVEHGVVLDAKTLVMPGMSRRSSGPRRSVIFWLPSSTLRTRRRSVRVKAVRQRSRLICARPGPR